MALDPMIQLFSVKQLGHPAQIGFDGEPLVPTPAFAAFDVPGWTIFLGQAKLHQHDCLTIIPARQQPKEVIGLIGRVPGSVDYLSCVVDQPGQLDTDNLALVRFAFLPNLALATTFVSRRDQLVSIHVLDRRSARNSEMCST